MKKLRFKKPHIAVRPNYTLVVVETEENDPEKLANYQEWSTEISEVLDRVLSLLIPKSYDRARYLRKWGNNAAIYIIDSVKDAPSAYPYSDTQGLAFDGMQTGMTYRGIGFNWWEPKDVDGDPNPIPVGEMGGIIDSKPFFFCDDQITWQSPWLRHAEKDQVLYQIEYEIRNPLVLLGQMKSFETAVGNSLQEILNEGYDSIIYTPLEGLKEHHLRTGVLLYPATQIVSINAVQPPVDVPLRGLDHLFGANAHLKLNPITDTLVVPRQLQSALPALTNPSPTQDTLLEEMIGGKLLLMASHADMVPGERIRHVNGILALYNTWCYCGQGDYQTPDRQLVTTAIQQTTSFIQSSGNSGVGPRKAFHLYHDAYRDLAKTSAEGALNNRYAEDRHSVLLTDTLFNLINHSGARDATWWDISAVLKDLSTLTAMDRGEMPPSTASIQSAMTDMQQRHRPWSVPAEMRSDIYHEWVFVLKEFMAKYP